jgi:hypothetical protein
LGPTPAFFLDQNQCGWQPSHANFKYLLPRQSSQSLPDLRKARLVLLFYTRQQTHLDLYARQ